MKEQINVMNSLAHTKWNCKYHIVFAPKYRRKVFFAEKRESIRDIIRQLREWKGGRNNRRRDLPRSCASTSKYSTKVKCIKFYGISKRKE